MRQPESPLPFVAPFAALVLCMAGTSALGLSPAIAYPLRTVIVLAVLLVFSRHVVELKPQHWFPSALMGIAVFLVWVGPDWLWPEYRNSWLFRNSLIGSAASTVAAPDRVSPLFLLFRAGGSALLVPIVEELFWRSWLMRWLVSRDFYKVPLGFYSAQAFWISAVLFASEHGAYWDVGLVAGILYNGWMVRTRSLADCILAHAVTNACLAVYVVVAGKWSYWL